MRTQLKICKVFLIYFSDFLGMVTGKGEVVGWWGKILSPSPYSPLPYFPTTIPDCALSHQALSHNTNSLAFLDKSLLPVQLIVRQRRYHRIIWQLACF